MFPRVKHREQLGGPTGSAHVTATPVTVYWRPGCRYCERLRRTLRRADVPVDERNIWSDEQAAAFVRSVNGGNETVPTVVIDGRALLNPRPNDVLALLGLEPLASRRRPRWLRRRA